MSCIRQWLEIQKQKSERGKYMKLGRAALPPGILGCWLPSPRTYQASAAKGHPPPRVPLGPGGLVDCPGFLSRRAGDEAWLATSTAQALDIKLN